MDGGNPVRYDLARCERFTERIAVVTHLNEQR